MSRATVAQWRESISKALRDGVIDAIPHLLIAMAQDGHGHEAETLRRELARAVEIAREQ